MTLKDKVAIVTGGNSAIGKAIALGLAKAGASIVIDYIADPDATNALPADSPYWMVAWVRLPALSYVYDAAREVAATGRSPTRDGAGAEPWPPPAGWAT